MAVQERVGKIARGQFERLGIAAKSTDTDSDRRMRPIVMSLMRFSKDVTYRKEIEEKYAYVDITKVDEDIRWVVASSLLRENDELSKIYYEIYSNTVDASLKKDMESALVATRSKETILSYLPKLKNGEIRPQDRLGFFYRLAANYAAQDEVIDWMYQNWEWLEKEEGDKTISDYPRYIATIIRTQEEADRYKAFFEQKIGEAAITREIKVGLADIEAKLKLIHEDQQSVFECAGCCVRRNETGRNPAIPQYVHGQYPGQHAAFCRGYHASAV